MKDFQLNYTTPEQSRWLLKLGLPAETADCVLENLDTAENDFAAKDYTRWIIEERHVKADIFTENNKGIFLPCWSVGRLIEIYHICDQPGCTFSFNVCFPNLVSEMIHEISLAKERGWIDFSRLEDFVKQSNVELNDEEQ